MKFRGIALAALMTTGTASAAGIVIPVPEGTEVERIEAAYDCGDIVIDVTYLNAGEIALAVLDIDGEQVVASNVISGSGARYAGNRYIWWSRGDEASLYDLMEEGEESPALTCATSR